jgi:cytochrome c
MRKDLNVRIFVAGVLLSAASVACAVDILEIAKKDGCMVCHRMDVKYLGPSFQDIADRYRDDPDAFKKMVDKTTNGGFGGWGRMPMPPSEPKYVSPEDVRLMVDFILKMPPLPETPPAKKR